MFKFKIREDVIDKIDLDIRASAYKKVLFGMMPSSPIHLGIDKLLVELKAIEYQTGAIPTIFLADIHSRFKAQKSSNEVKAIVNYYKNFIKEILGHDINIVLGSDIQFKPDYVEKLYQVASHIDISKIRNEVPKSMKISGERDSLSLMYLVMQCLDPIHLDMDAVFAEYSQQKIYDLVKNFAPFVNNIPEVIYTTSAHDIDGKFIQKSNSSTRICIHDSPPVIKEKIQRMFAAPSGQELPENRINALLECYQWSVFPFVREPIKIVSSKTNKILSFDNFSEFKSAYKDGWLHPLDCKLVLTDVLTKRCQYLDKIISKDNKTWLRMPHERAA